VVRGSCGTRQREYRADKVDRRSDTQTGGVFDAPAAAVTVREPLTIAVELVRHDPKPETSPRTSLSTVRSVRTCLAENPGPVDDLPEPQKMLALAKDGFETE
jgi:hypothetical protein